MRKGKWLTGLMAMSMLAGQTAPVLAAEEQFQTGQDVSEQTDFNLSAENETKIVKEGVIGKGADPAQAKWTLDDHGTMVIGSGTIEALNQKDWPWQKADIKPLVKTITFEGKLTIITDILSGMFAEMPNLYYLDVTGLDTKKVMNFEGMFANNPQLLGINLGNLSDPGYFRTDNAKYMGSLFAYCPRLDSPYLAYFNTSRVVDMSSMFEGCSNITTVDVSYLDTSHVKKMNNIFSYCDNLTELDFSKIDMSNVFYSSMFKDDGNLRTYKFGPKSKGDVIHALDEVDPYCTYWLLDGEGPYPVQYVSYYADKWKKDYGTVTRVWYDSLNSANPNSLLSLHRLYNPNSGEHFYTFAQEEKDHLVSLGWKYEDVAWKTPGNSEHPIYRLYNPNTGDHHFTANENERQYLINAGWNNEGIGFFAHSENEEGSIAIYRQYNPKAKGAGSHHYTADEKERDYLVSIGWKDEGIAWFAKSRD
ncbi:BspA family leucine-rich repeat surface protein [Erysipelotrichaceae bacterium RD49]|nr:BspA family leucine-rich repeat surface protein [Erysipelotrichaceae bacterium RD49]